MTISLKGRLSSLEIESTNSRRLCWAHYQLQFNARQANFTLVSNRGVLFQQTSTGLIHADTNYFV